ncbi:hypothetical protein ACWDCB_35065 [Streptomyces sp. NPDC001178]
MHIAGKLAAPVPRRRGGAAARRRLSLAVLRDAADVGVIIRDVQGFVYRLPKGTG